MKRALVALAACHAQAAHAWHPPAVDDYAVGDARVVLVENHRLPLVAIDLVEPDAGSREDGPQFGLAALAGDLIAPRLAGATYRVDVTSDATIIEVVASADRIGDALRVLALALEHPDETRFATAKAARLALIQTHQDRARTIAAQTFDRLVFGRHPYAHPAEGEAASVERLGLAELRAFHTAHFHRPIFVVAGDLDRAHLAPLLAPFHTVPATAEPYAVEPLAPVPSEAHVAHSAETEVILAGGRGQAAAAPDRIAADVANAMLGGAPGARLDQAFAGMSLAASSSFWRGAAGGSWTVAATVRAADLPRALETLKRELARRDFTDAELAAAKAQLRSAFPRPFETMAGTARAFARLVAGGAPLALYAHYLERVDAVTRAEATRAIDGLWRELTIVTVGP